MGPPPSYVITRRLVRNFFRQYIPNQPAGKEIDPNTLFDCWKKFGYDHPNCLEAENALGDAIESKANYKEKMNKLRIRQRIMHELRRPSYPSEQKGRQHESFIEREWNILDGIKR